MWSQVCITDEEQKQEQDPDPDPHHSDRSDPEPYQSERSDPDPHQSEKADQDSKNNMQIWPQRIRSNMKFWIIFQRIFDKKIIKLFVIKDTIGWSKKSN